MLFSRLERRVRSLMILSSNLRVFSELFLSVTEIDLDDMAETVSFLESEPMLLSESLSVSSDDIPPCQTLGRSIS